jgi:hypothetical protein
LLCTENNSDSDPVGKQSVSLVNALYHADSLSQLMQTEFNSYVWWDLRNGQATDGDLDPTLYGWRMYGDLGVMNGLGTPLTNLYPTFFSAKLMQYFVQGGDTVLATTSSYSLLSAYGVQRTNGALTLLVINKDPESNFTAQISLKGYTPSPSAIMYSYGMPQDNAAEAGSELCDIATNAFPGATSNFTCTFAPYSLTVFSMPPIAPSLAAATLQPGSNQFVLQLSGQTGAPYVLQTSTDLSTWTPVSTNYPGTITNTLPPGTQAQFWTAGWLP